MQKISIDKLEQDLNRIMDFWYDYGIDDENGGFYGMVDYNLKQYPKAERILILSARLIWGFSATYRETGSKRAEEMAHRSYKWFMDNAWDKENKGGFYSVTNKGEPVDDSKWTYGQAFIMYAFCEYYRAFKHEQALADALAIHDIFEKHIFTGVGCREVCNRDWTAVENQQIRLLPNDTKHSMNTHLHVLEAYTNLARVAPETKPYLKRYIDIMTDEVYNNKISHYDLYFDKDFNAVGTDVSFGHDIEGGWLMYEAAEVLGDEAVIAKCAKIAIDITDAQLNEGYIEGKGLTYEADENGKIIKPFISWWVQAETVVGCINAYQISKDEKYYHKAIDVLDIIENHIIEPKTGAWRVGAFENKNKPDMPKSYISGWKAPYHNVRMYLELLNRL